MVQVRDDPSEEVTDAYEQRRDGFSGICVETNGGYFEYWFPYADASTMDYVDADDVLDPVRMQIRENATPASEYTGKANVTVPKNVVDRAENVSERPLLE